MKSIADIQAELAAQSAKQAKADAQKRDAILTGNYSQPGDNLFGMDNGRRMQSQRKQNALTVADVDSSNAQLELARTDPSRSPGAALERIIGLGDEVYQNASADNPVEAMLMGELTKRIQGQSLPYDDTTINALKTGAADQAGAAEQANNQQAMASLESRGFTPNDPAYQAALSQNQNQRQIANQQANLSIAQNANLANYNAKGQAIAQANQVNRGRQGQQLAAAEFAKGGLNQVSTADMARKPSWQTLPTWSQKQKTQQPATQSF